MRVCFGVLGVYVFAFSSAHVCMHVGVCCVVLASNLLSCMLFCKVLEQPLLLVPMRRQMRSSNNAPASIRLAATQLHCKTRSMTCLSSQTYDETPNELKQSFESWKAQTPWIASLCLGRLCGRSCVCKTQDSPDSGRRQASLRHGSRCGGCSSFRSNS